jgi:transposase
VSAAAVCVWAKKLKKYGKESLQPSKASGRPSNLSLKQKSKLLKKMSAGAVAAGFESERWTLRRVQAMIETEFGVRYHANYISRLLHDLGWRVQKPETRAMERDEELIRSWLNQDWNRIKKARRLGAHRPDVLTGEIIFEDEFGISITETVSTTWAPRGQTPYLKRIGKYRREISTMAGLTISGKIYKKHFEGSIDSEKMLQGLEHFRRQIGRPFIMIWDRSRTH